MAQGLFLVGFTKEQVLQIQRRAAELLVEGKTVMSWNDSGTAVTKQFPMTVKETLEECAYALRVMDPSTFGRVRRVLTSVMGVFHK